jgi:hypothetical protein
VTLRPKTPKDLMLAPVAAEIDLNLQTLRDKSPEEIGQVLSLAFNRDMAHMDRSQRAAYVLDEAIREVQLHDWEVEITADAARLRLSGGSVSIDIGLSANILRFIDDGV